MDATQTARVLVVDDEPKVLETIAEILRREGLDVVAVATIEDAMAKLRRAPFDVLLTDLRLDGETGLVIVGELHRLYPYATAIVLTGYASLQSAVDALRQGVYDYLVKPCDVEELKATVARAIERSALARQLRERLEELDVANAKLKSFNEELWKRVEKATADLNGNLRELTEAKRRIEEAQRQREQFISMIAHELGQPLTMIGGYAQLLGRPNLSDEAQNRARTAIVSQTRRLGRLVKDLSDATSLAGGRFRVYPTAFDLREIVYEQVELTKASVEHHTLVVETSTNPITVVCDRDRMSQVLSNLLSNAVKYTDGGDIRVSLRESGGHVLLRIQDSGPGIPPDQLERIFEPHVRIQPDGKGLDVPSGAGLGLYIARGIVEAHGGRIWAENSARGAVLIILLPVGASVDAQPQESN